MTIQDMKEFAKFNRICINYIKMRRLLEEGEEKDKKVAKWFATFIFYMYLCSVMIRSIKTKESKEDYFKVQSENW